MIFENLTRWNTEDLRKVLDLSLSIANDRGDKIKLRVDTPVVARHYTAKNGFVSAGSDRTSRSAILRLRRPGRVDVEVVDALASVMDGGCGRMPREMIEHLFLAGVALARGGSYQDSYRHFASQSRPLPAELDALQVRVSRTRHRRSPAWLRRQLEAAERELKRIHERWKGEVDIQQGKINAIREKLAAQEEPS